MAVQLSTYFAAFLVAYLAMGLLVGIVFVLAGAKRIDPVARDGSWGFKLAILPASAALWPWMAMRWLKGATQPPTEKNAHRKAAGCSGCCPCKEEKS